MVQPTLGESEDALKRTVTLLAKQVRNITISIHVSKDNLALIIKFDNIQFFRTAVDHIAYVLCLTNLILICFIEDIRRIRYHCSRKNVDVNHGLIH